jgi:hypothetical protein
MFGKKPPKGVQGSAEELRENGYTNPVDAFRELDENDRHSLTKDWLKKDTKNLRSFIDDMFED